MSTEKLGLTTEVRYALGKMEGDTVESRILWYLYNINLKNGRIEAGHHLEASIPAIQKTLTNFDQDWSEASASVFVEELGLEWTNAATTITKLQRLGVVRRRGEGRRRYISIPYPLLLQINEALTTGRIVPAKDLKPA